MSVKYKLYQDTRKTSPNQGKWYARATVSNVATMQSMAEKIERATTVTRSDILAVLSGLSDVMRDELLAGSRVVMDGIGSFKVGMKTRPADTLEEWTPARHLKGYRIIFRPETIDNVSNGVRTRSAKALQGIKFEEMGRYSVEEVSE